MTLTSTPSTDKARAGGAHRRLRRVAIRPLLLIVVVLGPALGLAGCGQSAADKAKSQVCSARADINKQIDYLKGLTLNTATTTGVKNSLKAIGDDLTKIKDAQPQLNAERKQQVQSANQAFSTELESVVNNIGTNLSISNAEAQLKTAVQQLAQSYQQTFAAINCG
ncbi:MAG TPA: hypothetical protein VEF89_20065 [Solirubrobacteraceae bacterium]|nr:hypothetical protein [Solirubrobacteraceae bacterium]